jgi:hypothetical protein
MGLSKRAVDACERAMQEGRASERHVRDILACKDADVSRIEPFMKHPDAMVRLMAVKIVGQKGNIDSVIDAAKKEDDRMVQMEMLNQLGRRGIDGLNAFEKLLSGGDSLLREAAIEMFRKSGNKECLFPLLFDDSDFMVQRIKRYLDEKSGEGSGLE